MNMSEKIKDCVLGAVLLATCAATGNMTLSENVTLDADTDWRNQGTVTIGNGVTLDLNGHVLRVAAIAGTGRIIDSKDYDILDYVEATGAQRIVTDLVPDGTNTYVDVVFTPTSASPMTLFGTGTWSSYRYLAMGQNNNWYFFDSATVITTFTANQRYRFILSPGNNAKNARALLHDADTDQTLGGKGPTTDCFENRDNAALSICGPSNDNTKFGRYKIYSFKVWHKNAMRFDFVPARNPSSGQVGLLNRLTGTLHPSGTATAFVAGPVTNTLGIGALRVAAASETALAGFTGTVDADVRICLDGSCTLAADADWRAFGNLAIDGTVELAGHDLLLSNLAGVGTITDSSEAYDLLDYVESTGAQKVKTGIVPSTDTGINLDVTLYGDTSDRTIFGCTTWGSSRSLMIMAQGTIRYFGNNNSLCSWSAGTRYLISVTPGATAPNGTAKVVNAADGSTLGQATVNLTNNDTSKLVIFDYGTDNSNHRPGIFRLHSFQMTKNGVAVRDLVPAKSKSGKIGLLDRVSGTLLTNCTATALVAGPVTVTGHPGRVRVDVADGRKAVNDSVKLAGTLQLVKEGGGTLVASRAGQSYNGGTHVASGVLETLNGGSNSIYLFIASKCYLGASKSEITIDAGAVFDFKGNCDYRNYKTILNGGTIRNSGYHQQQGSGSLGTLVLTANSSLDTAFDTTFYDTNPIFIDLRGHALTVTTDGNALYFHNAGSVTNGTLVLEGSGWWRINKAVSARGVSLQAASALWLGGLLEVDDYYAACTVNLNNGTGGMNVYGRFTPSTDYFYGCTLQDGSTLDLGARTDAWSTTSAFTNGLNRVTFAAGATVTVDVHARPTWSGKIVDWGTGNMPSGVLFKLDDASKAMGRVLCVGENGLYAANGAMVIVY